MPIPTKQQIAAGQYPKTDKNNALEKEMLKFFGFPEDYMPTEEEATGMYETYTSRKDRRQKRRSK